MRGTAEAGRFVSSWAPSLREKAPGGAAGSPRRGPRNSSACPPALTLAKGAGYRQRAFFEPVGAACRRPAASRVGEGPARTTPRQPEPASRRARPVPSPESPGATTSPSENEDEGRRDGESLARLSDPGGRFVKRDFREAIAREVLLADGAMGTLLVSRGAAPDQAKVAAQPDRSRFRARRRTTTTGRGRPDPDDQHVGRQPREAHRARVGRLAREDQSRGGATRAGSVGRGARLRGRLDRPARRPRQAVRGADTRPGARDLRGTGAGPCSRRAWT